jgi:GNAT superfamily N-acetyltransferase
VSINIKTLEIKDVPLLGDAFLHTVWKTKATYFEYLLSGQNKGELIFLIARFNNEIAGFLYIKWRSEYKPFADAGIPEIKDLRVHPEHRRHHVAAVLMDEAEKKIFERSPIAGLGVGLYADYGPAQQMYARRGYVPDGRGLIGNNEPVKPGNHVLVDDDLVIYLTKKRA